MVHVDVLVGALNVLVGLLLIEDIALATMYINWKCDCGGVLLNRFRPNKNSSFM